MRNTGILLVTFSLTILALSSAPLFISNIQAQSFQEALELYQQEQFEEALEMFRVLTDDERAVLYTGKSYLALGEYLKSGQFLRIAVDSDSESISNEARFTLALNEYRLKNFRNSLELLNRLKSQRDRTGIWSQASDLYDGILNYLTVRQRYDVFWQTSEPEIRHDLVRSSIGIADYSLLTAMVGELEKLSRAIDDTTGLAEIRNAIGSEVSYTSHPLRQYRVPGGTVYPVGVALPSFEADEAEFAISRNLYFGFSMAAEEFNANHADKKIFLRFRDTHSDPDSIPKIVHELVWNERVDAMVGPLFSETARVMSEWAERYEVPLLTPLANSDDINLGHYYTFQLNPTFSIHGKQMARFAVEELELDTLAVMTQQNSLGQASAASFRREAEDLGAYVAYYIDEDFEALGYDLSDITEIFTRDPVLIDSLGYVPVDGIYAPFTGQPAPTLVNLLMTDLEAMGSDLVVMGSEEWGNAQYTNAQQTNFAIYHTQNYSPMADEERAGYFIEDFTNRFGFEPDQFARIGYDTGRYLFQVLEQVGNPAALKEALREAPEYIGLSKRIHFSGSQINRMVEVVPLTEKAREAIGMDAGVEPKYFPENR